MRNRLLVFVALFLGGVFLVAVTFFSFERKNDPVDWNPVSFPIHYAGVTSNGYVMFSFTNNIGFSLETIDYLGTPVEVQFCETGHWHSRYTRSDFSSENHESIVVLQIGDTMTWWTDFHPSVLWFVAVEASDEKDKSLWKGGAPIFLVSDLMNGTNVISSTNTIWREVICGRNITQ